MEFIPYSELIARCNLFVAQGRDKKGKDHQPDGQDLIIGCLYRIMAALETMNKNHPANDELKQLRHQVAGFRGYVHRLKKG